MSENLPAENSEIMAARFAQMIMQQANMALMLMGKVANPQSGEFMRDMDAAQYFIASLLLYPPLADLYSQFGLSVSLSH